MGKRSNYRPRYHLWETDTGEHVASFDTIEYRTRTGALVFSTEFNLNYNVEQDHWYGDYISLGQWLDLDPEEVIVIAERENLVAPMEQLRRAYCKN